MNKRLTTYKEIRQWLLDMNIFNFDIVSESQPLNDENSSNNLPCWIVNVRGHVFIENKELKYIPIQFNRVEGDFWCFRNQLVSLKGCPQFVGKSFFCSSNQLTSLEYCPQTTGEFDCSSNLLTSLQYCPQISSNSFNCSRNQLETLQYSPNEIGFNFDCSNNNLFSLEGCPTAVGGNFDCQYNSIETLEFCPEKVKYQFLCDNNLLLGTTQQIKDFANIKSLHQTYVNIKKEKHLLENTIDKQFFLQQSKTIKI